MNEVKNKIAQEVIILHSVWEQINEMVNFEIYEKITSATRQLTFRSMTNSKFFIIHLVDFLSLPSTNISEISTLDYLPKLKNGNENIDQLGHLHYLKFICDSPQFNNAMISQLVSAVEAFSSWLKTEAVIPNMWLPTLNANVDLRIKRSELIYICGNLSKHTLLRLDIVARKVKKILKRNKINADIEEVIIALEDCFEWFHNDILAYHNTTLAELLNNIRWGIYEYLRPEFLQSYKRHADNDFSYSFTVPESCQSAFSKTYYWNLMNDVRMKPYFPKFKTGEYLQELY